MDADKRMRLEKSWAHAYREALSERGLRYVVGINAKHVVWAPGTGPIAPSELPATNNPRTRFVTGKDKPQSVLQLALSRGRAACRTVHWREGSRGRQGARFGALRIRTAHEHTRGAPPGDEQCQGSADRIRSGSANRIRFCAPHPGRDWRSFA